MKRIISILLSLCMMLCFVACSDKETANVESSGSVESEVTSVIIPENYATVLTISINPIFKLYLDINGNVLSVEAANEDAKNIQSEIIFENVGFEAVIDKIIESANKNGFIKEEATVELAVTESKSAEVDLGNLLIKAEASVVSATERLEVKVTVTSENKTESAVSSAEETPSVPSSEESTSSETTSSEISSAVSSEVISSSESVSSHSHSFSAATCTEAGKCACGVTGEKALGHTYIEGICKRCNVTDPNFKFDPINSGSWTGNTINGDKLSQLTLFFEDAPYYTYSFATVATEAEINSGEAIYTFNGKKYCFSGIGDGGELYVTESGNTLILKDDTDASMTLKRTSNDTLMVTELKGNFTGRTGIVKVGTEFKLQKLPEVLNPKESLNKENQWKSEIILYDSKPDSLFQYTLYFENNYCKIHTDTWFYEDADYDTEDYVVRNNKKYYHGGGGGRPYNYELTEDKIFLKDTEENSSVLLAELTLLRNGNLKVIKTNTDSHFGLEKDLNFVCE